MILKNKRLAAVGFCCTDVYDELGRSYPTGNGVDWGIHLARMGLPVSVVSVVGSDAMGEAMRKKLSDEGIDISHLRVEKGATCQMHMALKNACDRVHLRMDEGVMKNYRPTKADVGFVAEHGLVHTDLFGKALEFLPVWKKACCRTLVDFSVFSGDPAFSCEDIFPNVDFAFLSTDSECGRDVAARIRRIQAQGPQLVVATMGENGSLCWDGSRLYSFGIFPAETVNTVGAGDSYIAGFTCGLMQGRPVQACMEMGARVSAGVVSQFEPY